MTSRPSLALALAFALASCTGDERSSTSQSATAPASAVGAAQTLEVGCATCVFEMRDVEGCVLAVKLDGKPYLVSGVVMPGHESGLCDRARQAELVGDLQGERFVATSFALKP